MACKLAKQIQIISFQRFVELLPNKPYCSDDLINGLLIRPRQRAITYRYIQPNPPHMQHWLVFDIDYDAMQVATVWPWESAKVPEPNIVSYNRDNGHCHLYYAIESVCTSPDAKPKPLHYLAAIQRAYTNVLKADRSYTGLIAKNPLHAHWFNIENHTAVFSLGDLAKHVELESKRWDRRRAANDDHVALGRNCALFHRLRYWAYDHVNDYRNGSSTYNQWMSEVLAKCEGYNDFSEPLPYGEVKSTARSVGKWVWKHYTGSGSGKRRGAMAEQFAQSQIPLQLETKQRLSARRTHETRRDETESKIIKAIESLKADGKRVTKAAVVRVSGVGRRTIYNHYSHLFTD